MALIDENYTDEFLLLQTIFYVNFVSIFGEVLYTCGKNNILYELQCLYSDSVISEVSITDSI